MSGRSVAAALSALLVLAACGSDPAPWEEAADDRAQRARQVAIDAGLDDAVADVMATLARTVEATYRVTYRAIDPNGATSTVTVTQRPPQRRIDVVAADRPDLSTIATGERSFTCVRAAGEWRCARGGQPPGIGALAEADAVATTEALARSVDDFDFTVTDELVANVQVRCLAVAGRGSLSETTARLCVAPDGPPLVVDRAGGSLTATSYTDDVDDDAFDLPAEPAVPGG